MGQVDRGVPRARRSWTPTEAPSSAAAPITSAGPWKARPSERPSTAPRPWAMSSQAKAALRRSTVMASPALLAHRSPRAGSAAAHRPREKRPPTDSRLAAVPPAATPSSAKATAGRGSRVPRPAQTGRSRRKAPQARAAPRPPARATHAQAANSVNPAIAASRSANLASSGNSRGRMAGAGRMRKRDSLGPCGANSSGSFSGTCALITHASAPRCDIGAKGKETGRAFSLGGQRRWLKIGSWGAIPATRKPRLRGTQRLHELRRAVHAGSGRSDPLRSLPGPLAARAALSAAAGRGGRVQVPARAGRRALLAFLAGRRRALARRGGEALAALRDRSQCGAALPGGGREARRGSRTGPSESGEAALRGRPPRAGALPPLRTPRRADAGRRATPARARAAGARAGAVRADL